LLGLVFDKDIETPEREGRPLEALLLLHSETKYP